MRVIVIVVMVMPMAVFMVMTVVVRMAHGAAPVCNGRCSRAFRASGEAWTRQSIVRPAPGHPCDGTLQEAKRAGANRAGTCSIPGGMSGFVTHPIDPALTVRVARDMPPLSDALDARVGALWDTAAKRVADGGAGRLFNGRIFSIDSIEPDLILGHWTEYRRHVAQLEDPALFDALGIRSLSACGVLLCGAGGTAPGVAIYDVPAVLNALSGAKFKIVSGYEGTAQIDVATERGELHG